MKKLLFTLFIATMTLMTNSSCAQKHTTLVAYFSATGTTEAVAKRLAKAADADLLEIEPATPYTAEDLDWTDKNARSTVEMKDPNSRPALKTPKTDLSAYDKVYIGFPIWWYTAPTIINTFIEANDLKGKTIVLFATSGGSTIAKAEKDLKAKYPDLKWAPGRLLNRATDEQLREFAK